MRVSRCLSRDGVTIATLRVSVLVVPGVMFARSCLVLIVMKLVKSGTFSFLLKEGMVLVEISTGEPCFKPVRPTRRCLAPSRTEPYR